MFKPGAAVLVTGGAGYVGAHAAKALASCGLVPITFDNLACGHEDFVKWGPFVEGDLQEAETLSKAFRDYCPIAVMHFAAHSYVGESVRDPSKYYRNNVCGTLNLLDAMRAADCRALIFSSTCATYGVPTTLPIPETHCQRPINPYGATKLAIERMLVDFGTAYGLRSVALRYFNAAGADPEAEIGEDHDPETHLIPLALDAASGRGPALVVFGDDYETRDGTCIRDYIHVTDLADAHVKALEHLLDNEGGVGGLTAFNLGNGRGFTVREVIESVERVTGLCVPRSVGARRAGDPPALVGSSGLARSVLCWEPARGDIDAIVADAWRWHRLRFPGSKAAGG